MTAVTGKMSEVFGEMNKALEDEIFGKNTKRIKSSLEIEEVADPKQGYGLLHPLSPRRKWYDLFQVALLMWTAYYVPMRIAFAYEPTT